MSEKAKRIALFAVATALLGAVGAYLSLSRGEEGNREKSAAATREAEWPRGGKRGDRREAERRRAVNERVARVARRVRRQSAEAEDVEEGERATRRFLVAQEGAFRTVRAFLRAFLRYEVGEVDAAVRRGLRESATEEFASQLLGAPPRVPAGVPRAHLVVGEMEFVPLDEAARRAQINGTLERAGRREAFSFTVEHFPGGWLVSGVGR